MALKLKPEEKEAISAIVTELFRAETFVGLKKLKLVNDMMNSSYQISSRTIKRAKCITLEKAVSTLLPLDIDFKKEFLERLHQVSREDGFCSPDEAIMLESLEFALIPQEGKESVSARIFSMRSNQLNFDGKKACYIHPHKNLVSGEMRQRVESFSDKIGRHLDELVLLFYCFGYDFVYIPQLRKDFGHDPDVVEQLMNFSFFFSDLPKQNVEMAIKSFGEKEEALKFTTSKFANILFSGREHDSVDDHNEPAFLIKVCDSFVMSEVKTKGGDKESLSKKHYNFLYIPVVANGISGIIDTVKDFFQKYIDKVDRATCLVNPEPNHRLRHFDLYQSLIARIAREGIYRSMPEVVLDRFNEELVFKSVLDGKDIRIDIKSDIAEYLFVLWWTQHEKESIPIFEAEYGPIDENYVLVFIRQILNKEVRESLSYRDTFRHLPDHIRSIFKRKGLNHLLDNMEIYIPRHNRTDHGPRAYRLGFKDIRIRELVDKQLVERDFKESSFNDEVVKKLTEWYEN